MPFCFAGTNIVLFCEEIPLLLIISEMTFTGRIDDTMWKKDITEISHKKISHLGKSDEWWFICTPLQVLIRMNSSIKKVRISFKFNQIIRMDELPVVWQLTLLLLFMIDARYIKILLWMDEAGHCAQLIKCVEPSGSFSFRWLKVMASARKSKNAYEPSPVTICWQYQEMWNEKRHLSRFLAVLQYSKRTEL